VTETNTHLARIAKLYGKSTEVQAKAQALQAELDAQTPERIFDEGLHEFLSRFILHTAEIAGMVHDTYLSGDMR
jgi:uncharacterized alpha-E superfamily protein